MPKNWCFWTVVLEKTLESPSDCKESQPVHPKGNQSWIFIGRTDAEAEAPILWLPDAKNWLIWKDPDAGKDWGQEEKRVTEDEMAGWHHWLDGHESEWATGLACCGSWGRKSWTWVSNWTELNRLTLGNELSKNTHVLTKRETLLARGAWAKSNSVREPRTALHVVCSLGFYGCGISFWVVSGQSLCQGPSWQNTHSSAKMDTSVKDSGRTDGLASPLSF